MGQQMTHMVWKMEKLDKLEKQNEYLLKEMRRLKKGGRRRRYEESEMSSADEGDPNAPKRPKSSTKRKRSHSSDYLMSSSEEDEQEEQLANWPLKTYEEVDQVSEKMKDPVYHAALVSNEGVEVVHSINYCNYNYYHPSRKSTSSR